MIFDSASFLKNLTHKPGVYRMISVDEVVLYVGKAKDLKRRVSSYFNRANNRRIQSMVSQINSIEVTVTHTEAEALLLENNLIKSLKPKYNVLLKDDKSYPYLYLSDDKHARLSLHRGAKKKQGRYFGPYPSAGAARETLHLLQRVFPVRQCENSYYKNRARPCLQYQIKRCKAPCVDYVTQADYKQDVDDTVLFLEGKTQTIISDLVKRMDLSAINLEYEQAAITRDQIDALRRVQERQYVSGENGNLDIVVCELAQQQACVQIFFIRDGRNLGNKCVFMKVPIETPVEEIQAAFIAQYYLDKQVPNEILVNHMPLDSELLQNTLTEQAKHKVKIHSHVRSNRARWLKLAEHNAVMALQSRLANRSSALARTEALQKALDMDRLPVRMECFDISHTSGQQTVASCVVFNEQGAVKSDYRRFNIEGVTPGDDYAAMAQALGRRYKRQLKENNKLPDILFIDGGKGQLSAAVGILDEIGITDLFLVGVAKGADRKAGMEQLFLLGEAHAIILPSASAASHLIQNIRDEAHRFAITGHRQRRAKAKRHSVLEDVPGIGPKRRQQLLTQFGGLQGVKRAGVEDLMTIDGINKKLAEEVYEAFH